MEKTDLYTDAHLFVSAIRILENQKGASPSIEDVCRTISVSLEQGNMVCRKLNDMEIIEVVEGAYGTKLFVRNFLLIEEIPKEAEESKLEDEIKKFQDSKKGHSKELEAFRQKQKQKKKDLFAELNQKLKKGIDSE